MTREEMIAYVLDAIQVDANLLKVMRFVVTNNINNATPEAMPDMKLSALIAYLQS